MTDFIDGPGQGQAQDEAGHALPGEFSVGDIVGNTYIVRGYLGRGAMGHVYHVQHQMLGAEYALKTLSSDRVTDLAWRRFQNEAQAIARLNHPNIVQIYNLGVHNNKLPFYAMDLLIGCDLGEKLQADGRLDPLVAAALFTEVCWGVGFAHKNGIVHRDLKPGNIFLLQNATTTGARVKVVDFGIAKLAETKDPLNQMLTTIGDVVGTPFYMSPEQCMGERVDARSDIYSLGCALFESLTGVLPFKGRNPTDTMLLHQQAEIPTLLKASGGKYFGPAWEMLVATAMAKLPEDRFQTMDSFGRDLQGILAGQSSTLVSGMSVEALRNTNAIGAQAAGQSSQGADAGGETFNALIGEPENSMTGATMGLAALVRSSLSNRAETVTTPRISGDAHLRKVLLPIGAGVTVLAAVATYFCWPKPEPALVKTSARVSHSASAEPQAGVPAGSEEGSKSGSTIDSAAMTGEAAPEANAFEDEIVPFDGSLPQHQYPSTELLSKKPFCGIIDDNNVKYRYFDFPKDVVVGIMTSDHQQKPFKAYGRFKIPKSDWLVFVPTDAAQHSPGCLKRFSAGDIDCVRFDPRYPQDEALEQVADIPDLKMLDLENCWKVTARGAENFTRFKNLKTLDVAYSSVDGAMLKRGQFWNSVEDLNLARLQNPRPFLDQLGRFKHLQRLTIKEVDLSDRDIAAIASLPKIYYLDLSDSGYTHEQLKVLSGMKGLTELGLHGCGLGPNDADVLRGFTSLHHLYIKDDSDKPGLFEKMQKLLPKINLK